ncbi:hypothetical protein BDN70DRAFT_899547 [Pholiota conissans]|uniref:Uncharacterized protein n=1 Tax=Pholiota conissans TaxID=109636 RepID=A0A9P5YTW5_9AGAR|nr:hypothetical protein BDN70DRAFT_899547 [Pholiota conissans]
MDTAQQDHSEKSGVLFMKYLSSLDKPDSADATRYLTSGIFLAALRPPRMVCCRHVADPLSEGVLKCRRETQFYDLHCVSLEWAPRNWVFESQVALKKRPRVTFPATNTPLEHVWTRATQRILAKLVKHKLSLDCIWEVASDPATAKKFAEPPFSETE